MMKIITTEEEWHFACKIRKSEFFDKAGFAEDPYVWTFDHPEHKHFVFYNGADIVSYAHIQLWPENRAAFRIIVTDEKARGKGFGSKFLTLIEKWLKDEAYKSIHAESSPGSVNFYKKHGYILMDFNCPSGDPTHPLDTEMGKIL